MNYKLILAIVFITSALIFYTIGVFGEKKGKNFKKETCNYILAWVYI